MELERDLDGIAVHRRADIDEPSALLECPFDAGARELVRRPRRVAPLEIELAVPRVDDDLRSRDLHAAILTSLAEGLRSCSATVKSLVSDLQSDQTSPAHPTRVRSAAPRHSSVRGYGDAVTARLFWMGWLFHVKTLTNSLFFVLVSVLQPIIFASIAFFMVESGNQAGTLLYVALGAGLMGIWSATLFGSGGAIQWQRWQGTLELLVGAPPPFVAVLLPLTVATSTIGIYSVVATLVWGRLFFGMPLDFAHPLQLAVALPTTVLSLGMLGLLLASTFVLYRNANAFSNLLEYPVWLATGLLVPLTLLPGWVAPIGWVLSPTWGMRAIRQAAFGGNAWPEIALCVGLGIVYVALGALALRNFERLARSRATLSLT